MPSSAVPAVLEEVAIFRSHPERGDLSLAGDRSGPIHLPHKSRLRKTVHGFELRLDRGLSPRRRRCWHEVLPPLPPQRLRRRAIPPALCRPLAHQGTSFPLPLRPAPPSRLRSEEHTSELQSLRH